MNIHDPVNWPTHYIGADGLQTIDVIEDWGLGFHLGNAFKYIVRAPKKGNMIQDCAKAIWYLERAQEPSITDTLAIDNAPFAIGAYTVATAFSVPRGALRDAIDDIQMIALMRNKSETRRLRLAASVNALSRWISATREIAS